MAIDPKELRIGCHINSDFGMVKVYSLPLNKYDHMPVSEIQVRAVNNDSAVLGFNTDFDPIPITPELLTELGFELNEDWNKCLRGSKRLENLDGFIQFKKLGSEFDNLWEMIVGVENGKYQLTQCLFVHYIHEAEQFLYLTTKQELINE